MILVVRSQEQKQQQQIMLFLGQVHGTPLANLPTGIQTWEFPCLSRQATSSEVCGTERGTLSPSTQFNAVVVPASASYTNTRHTPRFASYSWLQSQTGGWTSQISNVPR